MEQNLVEVENLLADTVKKLTDHSSLQRQVYTELISIFNQKLDLFHCQILNQRTQQIISKSRYVDRLGKLDTSKVIEVSSQESDKSSNNDSHKQTTEISMIDLETEKADHEESKDTQDCWTPSFGISDKANEKQKDKSSHPLDVREPK